MSSGNSFGPDGPTVVEGFGMFFEKYYDKAIAELAQRYPRDQQSLWIDHSDLYAFNPDMADDLRENPKRMFDYAEEALRRYELPVDVDLSNAHVRVTGVPGEIYPDEVSAADIGTLVPISGQLARVTQKKPKMAEGAFECARCGTLTRIPQPMNDTAEPHECQGCDRKGPFRINTEQSRWVDQRKVKLEEPIEERAQARGHSVPVYVEDDLCDYGPGETALPDHAGEHATITGVVRVDKSKLTGRNAKPESSVWIEAKAISYDTDVEAAIDVDEHRNEIEELASREDAVELVAESLAPSLHAEEEDDLHKVRMACAAWLFNAYRLDPEGSESKRGDMHMALIGDPGTGKSTIMKYLHEVLPKSEYRTGPGLTEAGLTAAAVQEEFAGETEWTLQPGVLPRADGGHCLIDEVDAVVDENTKAIHDALEGEQKVKADKAGIKADLPTRCALLVGGNPTYTRFDKHEPITDQIDLDPALFDRMDLVFALEEEVDEERDRTKAEHTLDAWDELSRAEVEGKDISDSETMSGPVSKPVLRAWIKHARETVRPVLTAEAKEKLQDYYVEVRNLNDGYEGDGEEAIPATMRTLEAGIRISMAFARLRLSDRIEAVDAERAIDLSRHVVGMRFDRESGQFDMQMTSRGDTQSQKNRKERVKNAILTLQDQGDDDGATMEEIVDNVDADPDKVEGDVEKFKQSRPAKVMEVRNGVYRWIS